MARIVPFEPRGASNVRFVQWLGDSDFPTRTVTQLVYGGLRLGKLSRVAIKGDPDVLGDIPQHLAQYLDPRRNYHWSGVDRRPGFERPAPRVLMGDYTDWFQWYMQYQRFRAFRTVIAVDPSPAIIDAQTGGFIDGLLARLMRTVPQFVIVWRSGLEKTGAQPKKSHVDAVLLALLYGTRLSREEIIESSRDLLVPIPEAILQQTLDDARWSIRRDHSRYELSSGDRRLVQGMTPAVKWKSEDEPEEIEQLFEKTAKRRFIRPEDSWIESQVLATARQTGWFTIQTLNQRLQKIFESFGRAGAPPPESAYPLAQRNRASESQVFLPSLAAVRRVCNSLVSSSRLSSHVWYREVGRPSIVYMDNEIAPPFKEESRCGQCVFYVPVKRRCRLWWLANKRQVFYDPRWKQAGSHVTEFDIHKMRYASRIGPHSSACLQFLDKKRDHLRKTVPGVCEICGYEIPPVDRFSTTCPNCNTRYIRWRGKVKVMTAYEHEFRRRYRETTGGDAKADLEKWVQEMKENLRFTHQKALETEDFDDALAAAPLESEPEPPRVWPQYNEELQANVDEIAATTDMARQLSLAMAQSALNATRRIASFSKLYSGDVDPILALQERYAASISGTDPTKLLAYEALIMKQYWHCFGLALKGVQQWFGPRKRSRFVREFVYDSIGRARGYSPIDTAINYLHQRRLRQAERINAEVGFPGTCDGFLHKERYNSRKVGLLLDMIDPFKFADREELLLVVQDQGLTWRDFKVETDRRGSNFYYPAEAAKVKLDQIGAAADALTVRFQEKDVQLSEAYKQYSAIMLQTVLENHRGSGFHAFAFEPTVG